MARECFSPWDRLTTEPAHTLQLVRCTRVHCSLLALPVRIGKAPGLRANATHVHLTTAVATAWRAADSFCQLALKADLLGGAGKPLPLGSGN